MFSHKARGNVTTAYHRTLISLPERCKVVYVSERAKYRIDAIYQPGSIRYFEDSTRKQRVADSKTLNGQDQLVSSTRVLRHQDWCLEAAARAPSR